MSWVDGMGEIDGWCHRCGAELGDAYHRGMVDFCARCAQRVDVRASLSPQDRERLARYWRRHDDEEDTRARLEALENLCPNCGFDPCVCEEAP